MPSHPPLCSPQEQPLAQSECWEVAGQGMSEWLGEGVAPACPAVVRRYPSPSLLLTGGTQGPDLLPDCGVLKPSPEVPCKMVELGRQSHGFCDKSLPTADHICCIS